jgi:hypothetical protein
MYFLLLSSKPPQREILKISTILMIFESTVSLANVGPTPAIILAK